VVLTCPNCGYPQYCGCNACAPRIPAGFNPQKVCSDGEGYICANCGFTASCDQWLDIEVQQVRERDPTFLREGERR